MDKPTNDETITFYDVPLVCGAAPEIGCGSRAKPLLLDLEQQTEIKEAWLNRTGTIVAIVWRTSAHTEEAVQPVFERHQIHYAERRKDNQTTESFHTEGAWLRGAEVDRLSLEEAREMLKPRWALQRRIDWSPLKKPNRSDPALKHISGKSLSSSGLVKNCCKIFEANSLRRCSTST